MLTWFDSPSRDRCRVCASFMRNQSRPETGENEVTVNGTLSHRIVRGVDPIFLSWIPLRPQSRENEGIQTCLSFNGRSNISAAVTRCDTTQKCFDVMAVDRADNTAYSKKISNNSISCTHYFAAPTISPADSSSCISYIITGNNRF